MIEKKYMILIFIANYFMNIKMSKYIKKSFLIRYAKTRCIKNDKLFDSFNFSSSVIYLLRDVDEEGKLENIHY